MQHAICQHTVRRIQEKVYHSVVLYVRDVRNITLANVKFRLPGTLFSVNFALAVCSCLIFILILLPYQGRKLVVFQLLEHPRAIEHCAVPVCGVL